MGAPKMPKESPEDKRARASAERERARLETEAAEVEAQNSGRVASQRRGLVGRRSLMAQS